LINQTQNPPEGGTMGIPGESNATQERRTWNGIKGGIAGGGRGTVRAKFKCLTPTNECGKLIHVGGTTIMEKGGE